MFACVYPCIFWWCERGSLCTMTFQSHYWHTHTGLGMPPPPFNSIHTLTSKCLNHIQKEIIHAFYYTNRKLHFYWVNKQHTHRHTHSSCAHSICQSIFCVLLLYRICHSIEFFLCCLFICQWNNNPELNNKHPPFYLWEIFRILYSMSLKCRTKKMRVYCCFHFICLFYWILYNPFPFECLTTIFLLWTCKQTWVYWERKKEDGK